jgi:hypothetical protein
MKELLNKINLVKQEIGKISKDSINPFHKSKYFDINQLLEHVEPLLTKHGLLLIQPIKNGAVHTMIIDLETGEEINSCIDLALGVDPQKMGSQISYYRRYTLTSLLAIQAEDDDANTTMPPEKPWLNENAPEWKEAVKYIESGGSIADIKKKYKLSKKSEEKLK